jgi:hypothetical protein
MSSRRPPNRARQCPAISRAIPMNRCRAPRESGRWCRRRSRSESSRKPCATEGTGKGQAWRRGGDQPQQRRGAGRHLRCVAGPADGGDSHRRRRTNDAKGVPGPLRRETFELKCAGVASARLSERSSPPSAMSLHGPARHFARVERWWFAINFAGANLSMLYYCDDDPIRTSNSWPENRSRRWRYSELSASAPEE